MSQSIGSCYVEALMRMFVVAIILAMMSLGSMALCENVSPSESDMTLSEIDARIKEVKRQIHIYQNRAPFKKRQNWVTQGVRDPYYF